MLVNCSFYPAHKLMRRYGYIIQAFSNESNRNDRNRIRRPIDRDYLKVRVQLRRFEDQSLLGVRRQTESINRALRYTRLTCLTFGSNKQTTNEFSGT